MRKIIFAAVKLLLVMPALVTATVAAAQEQNNPPDPLAADTAQDGADESWALHGQFTNLSQRHPGFRSLYSGSNSLDAHGRTDETTDLTLYGGVRLWPGAELWLNPEIDQGFGLSDTVGLAGFSSGEAYKIGANAPYLRLPRIFIRQVIPLGGAREQVAGMANQLGGMRAADNLTFTLGKFSVTDIFDTNTYAHDPRADFMNWATIDAGAFDYAADAWGFTYGAAAEWKQDSWTLRGGYFQLSPAPNGKITGINFKQYSLVVEGEARHDWFGHPGKIKLLAFVNRAPMGRYRDAVQLGLDSGGAPDTALVRREASRPGFALNIEQELAADVGAFLRASVNDGAMEAYEFTEINKSLSAGLSLKGGRWGRKDDTLGVAAVVNGLSGAAQAYFAAGGIGILIGDGGLNYGSEQIFETYYSLQLGRYLNVAFDYQHVANPAYNRDRGPVSIYGLRLHSEF
ncbi:MAG TPA: carbohydrate porin [Janthinobacterium sp.]|nr:carbohydrate porin [Janthinobacterium sp.]